MFSSSKKGNIFSLTNHEIYLVTAAEGEEKSGMIATWLMPATLAQGHLRLTLAISKHNQTFQHIENTGLFVVNLLERSQYKLAPLFGLYSSKDVDKFRGMKLDYTKNNIPLIRKSCGWIECKVVASTDSGDRIILLADAIDESGKISGEPLCKNDLFKKLPFEVCEKMAEKRLKDGIRDKKLIKSF